MPAEPIVYFGDTARLPYGTKSAETIRRFAAEDAEFLLGRGVKLVVVACHSASSVALLDLARQLPVPVLGVIEPGARALVAATRSGRVAVIGTSATIRAGAYEQAIRNEAGRRVGQFGRFEVIARATPLFVPLAEEGWLENDVAEAAALRYLGPLAAERVDALLLGCTHYPLLAPLISRVVGPQVRLVDSAEETAAEAERLLAGRGLSATTASPGSLTVYLSDLTPNFETIGSRFLGEPLGDVLRATAGKG
jgi:glutamate racemase